MKTWKKAVIIVGAVVLLGAIAGFTIQQSRKNVVTVQTATARRENLTSLVTASGEIKPKDIVNIGANAFGKITRLYVREGDRVKRGTLLAQLENVQPTADVAATQAALEAARTDALAAAAGLNTSEADVDRAKADAEHARLDYDRAQAMWQSALIAKQEFDTRKAAWETSQAALVQAKARVAQAKAQLDSSQKRIAQNQANLTRMNDVLSKTSYVAPFDGTITNLPVREGETVVIGIQNSPGSTLMTLADMSVVTAEVKVDETDIINVKMNQPADVTIDAFPKRVFKGYVSQIGDNAMLRSTGVSSSQATTGSEEAKDFKVVVTLTNPPENLRPGLSCTAKITTATSQSTLSIPIQALTIRQAKDLLDPKDRPKNSAPDSARDKEELQGVFLVRNRKAEFVKVNTGITGATDIEITSGLKEGDEVITGSYKVLRSLKNGASVKIDNSTPKLDEEKS